MYSFLSPIVLKLGYIVKEKMNDLQKKGGGQVRSVANNLPKNNLIMKKDTIRRTTFYPGKPIQLHHDKHTNHSFLKHLAHHLHSDTCGLL